MFSRAGAGSRKKKFPEPPQNRTAPKPCLLGPSANQMLVTWPTWRARGDEPSWPAGPGPRAGCAPTQSPPPPPGLCRRRGRRQGPAGIPASRSPAGGRPAPPSPCSAGGGRQHTFTVKFKWLKASFPCGGSVVWSRAQLLATLIISVWPSFAPAPGFWNPFGSDSRLQCCGSGSKKSVRYLPVSFLWIRIRIKSWLDPDPTKTSLFFMNNNDFL